MTRARRLATSALLAAALAGGASPLAGQTPTFGARVEAVYVDAFVTRGGRPLLGLQASNFELKDNGVRQRVELVATESQPLSAALVFDTSGSVKGEKLEALRVAGSAFLDSLRPADELALITFNQAIDVRVPPTRDRATLRRALERLDAGGTTAVMDALHAALTLLGPQRRSLVVLFTDGEDNMSWLGERQLRSVVERSNALVHVVGVGARRQLPALDPLSTSLPQAPPEPEHQRALRQLAELTGGRFWEAESPARLKDAFVTVVEAMNTRYVLSYEPQGVRRGGWHRIELRLSGRKGEVTARRGYWGGGLASPAPVPQR